MPASLREKVEKYVALVQSVCPSEVVPFRKGKPVEKLIEIAAKRGVQIPMELLDIYCVVDGQKSSKVTLVPIVSAPKAGVSLGSMDDLVSWHVANMGAEGIYRGSQRRRYVNPKEVKGDFWQNAWFPIALGWHENIGMYFTLFVDFEPSEFGTVGQVVLEELSVTEGCEVAKRMLVACSLGQFFDGLIELLSQNRVYYDRKKGLSISGPVAATR